MIQTFLLTTPRDTPKAAALGLPCGFFCYRIGPKGTLQRTALPAATHGGLLGLTEAPGLSHAEPEALAECIAAECSRQGYRGVLLGPSALPDASGSLAALCTKLQQRNLPCFAPPSLARAAPECRVILPGTLSGGTLEEMLDAFAAQYGSHRICLDVQRCCHSFSMPGSTPDGTRLTRQALDDLRQQYQPDSFFSPALCTNYFTYCPQPQEMRLVLFDDPPAAARRLQQADARGIQTGFLLYSEWGSDAKAVAELLSQRQT